MAAGELRVIGGRELRSSLADLETGLADLKEAHKKAATIAANASADLAPKRTGTLARTIRATGTKTAGVIRSGSKRIPYAGPIHWGWHRRHITAQPFLSDGARSSEGRWIPVYQDHLLDLVDKVKGA